MQSSRLLPFCCGLLGAVVLGCGSSDNNKPDGAGGIGGLGGNAGSGGGNDGGLGRIVAGTGGPGGTGGAGGGATGGSPLCSGITPDFTSAGASDAGCPAPYTV